MDLGGLIILIGVNIAGVGIVLLPRGLILKNTVNYDVRFHISGALLKSTTSKRIPRTLVVDAFIFLSELTYNGSRFNSSHDDFKCV
jgi:hypothetical protein